jgi:hypothetical protein
VVCGLEDGDAVCDFVVGDAVCGFEVGGREAVACGACGFEGVDIVVVVVGEAFLNVPVARTSSSILLVAGVAGVCCILAVGFAVGVAAGLAAGFCATGSFSTTLSVLFLAFTSSTTALFAGATGFAGFVASFFAATVFAVRAGAVFALTTFSLPTALFVLALLVPTVSFPGAIDPASSVATFFGRPRFFASVVAAVDIVEAQLVAGC